MSMLQLRLTASDTDTAALISQLDALEGVDSVEEVADLMPNMDDADSSSAGLPDDTGPGTHLVLVRAADDSGSRRALEVAKACARQLGLALEVEDSRA